jgi:OmpA-OmpF porin, OOP family
MKGALFVAGVLVVGFGILTYADPKWAPENLGSPVNTASNETQVGLTHSGRSLYIVTNRAGFGANDIWVSQRSNPQAPWKEPFNPGAVINGAGNDSSPAFTPDDLCMFYAAPLTAGSGAGQRIFRTCRTDPADDTGWETPVRLGPNVNIVQSSDPFYFVDPATGEATLYFAAFNRPGGAGDFDLFKSDVGPDGEFLPAVPVVELNTLLRETHPTIHQNGLIMVFSSNRPGGLGNIDLWVSTRASTADAWGAPCNLGPAINSGSRSRSVLQSYRQQPVLREQSLRRTWRR